MAEWRAVLGWPRYQVSDDGRVKSGRGELRVHEDPDGRAFVWLHAKGRRRPVAVARLVCAAFHGPAPSSRHRAVLLDGKPPHAGNVAWMTRREQRTDPRLAKHEAGAETARLILACGPPPGTRPPRGQACDVAAALEVSASAVRRIWRRDRRAHVGAPNRQEREEARLRLGLALP